jgi:uncharacterized protein YkwD
VFLLYNIAMLKWFKKHFIPHEGNDHRPHFLRGKNTRNLVLIVFALEFIVLLLPYIPAFNIANNRFTASILPSVLDDLTNQNRQAEHLAVLTVNPLLNEVAQLKADDMAAKGYFAHTSPDGKAPWYWFKQVGYNYSYAGENLAVDFTDSQDVTVAWMNSPEHRANILKDAYTEVGTGVATGTYQGNPTIFVAQEFGKPASATVAEMPVKVAVNTAPTSLKVLGAEATLVATQTPTIAAPVVNVIPSQTYTKTNIFEKYLTSPRHIANIVLAVIAILVALALLLKLFIRMDKRHPRLITNGLIVLVLIFGVYVANNYMASVKMAVTTSFASFQGNQFDQNQP